MHVLTLFENSKFHLINNILIPSIIFTYTAVWNGGFKSALKEGDMQQETSIYNLQIEGKTNLSTVPSIQLF